MMPQWKTMGALVLIGLWLGACATIGDQAGGPKDDPTAGPAERHYARGKKFLEQRKFSDALAEFEQAIALNPNNVSAFEGIALVHLGLGNLAKAEEMAETAKALDRKVPLLPRVTRPARPSTTPVGPELQERPKPSAPPALSSGLAATREFVESQERPRPSAPPHQENSPVTDLSSALPEVRYKRPRPSASSRQENPPRVTRVDDRPQADLAPPRTLASDVDQFIQKASECAQPDPRKWAMVVGIERYLQGNIPAVPFARHDALIVKEYVRKLLCVPEKNLFFLLDDRATLTQWRLFLDNRLPAWVQEGDTVFFYFAGHGIASQGQPYLVPYDGDPLAPQTSGYAIRALYSSLDQLQGAQVHVYLDACFSGGTRSGEPLLPGGVRDVLLEVEDPILLSHKLVVLTAARGNQVSFSFEEQGHGLFTYYLLKGLRGEAAVTVRKQPVTVKALAEYVRKQVREQARSLFGLERPQEPVLQPTPPRERGEWVLREMR